MKPFILFSLILLFSACNSSKEQKQAESLIKMIAQTDSLNQVLLQHKMDSLVEYQIAANGLMIRVRTRYIPKKVDLDFGRKVEEFRFLQKLVTCKPKKNKRSLSGEYSTILSSLLEEKKTLDLLKKDIENGRGKKDEYNEFIQFENDKINSIKVLLDEYIRRKKHYLPKFKKSMRNLDAALSKWENKQEIE